MSTPLVGSADKPAARDRLCPLVVDLDGTLTPTDTLIESVLRLIKSSPSSLLRVPLWLARGKGAFKEAVATRVRTNAGGFPYRQSLLAYLHAERVRGRRIVLATAAHESIAQSVAAHLGLFDDVIATDSRRNLKGLAKLAAIRELVGPEFVYAGDSSADIPIWNAASGAVLVGVSSSVKEAVGKSVPIEREFSREPATLVDWARALRVHQWLKNLLLFVPLLTAFSFSDLGRLAMTVLAFVAFSLAASATYIANDLLDLDSDRAHPRKSGRPFASGRLSSASGLLVAVPALLSALAVAWMVSPAFLLMLLGYLVLTSAYSLALKAYVLIDVLVLATLYTVRILAGSVASGISTSFWLLAFSAFTFLSLALVKRCSELVSSGRRGQDATRGRDYRVSDLVVLWPLGIGAALSGVVVFALFATAPDTQARYATPSLLWLVAIGLVFWLGRLWIKTARGEMHDDPIVYAIKDRGSRITVLGMIGAMCAARYLEPGLLP